MLLFILLSNLEPQRGMVGWCYGAGYTSSAGASYNLDYLVWFGCFGFNGPLRQYFSLYRATSQREGERGEKIAESKNVQTTPTRTYCKRNRPLPYYQPNCRTPRHGKFTQNLRTTRPPPIWIIVGQVLYF